MTYNLSIFSKTAAAADKINNKGVAVSYNGGPTYGLNISLNNICRNMKWVFYALWSFVLITSSAVAENEYFPGLRRPPIQLSQAQWLSNDAKEVHDNLIKTINELIEEQARRRFIEHLQRSQLSRNGIPKGPYAPELEEISGPDFSYHLPFNNMIDLTAPIPFAVNPSDPRFYDRTTTLNNNDQAAFENNNMDEVSDIGEADEENSSLQSREPVPYYKLKAPMHVNPKILHETDNTANKKMSNYEEDLNQSHRTGVIQKPLEMDGTMGMYIVALIAGISAAVTVGLISVGIGWYTLHKKAKAAADIEYPAYGVTGPNKDVSPSGDRRLAQSAQMYHYQHQKQQIIAMENHANGEKNGTLSEAESDDENEEGDYTVYECPGLAPTGEMEVKNPLFLDDPTPATPANLQQSQQHAQSIQQQTNETISIGNPVFNTELKKVNEKK